MRSSIAFATVVVGACLAAVTPAKASFVGDTVSVNYDWPNVGTVLFPGGSQAIAAGGTTFDLNGGRAEVTVTGTNILVSFPEGWNFQTVPKNFDGLVITDASANITGLSLSSSNIPAYSSSYLSFDSHNVLVDFPYPPYGPVAAGSSLSIDVQFASTTPEPGSWILFALGLTAGALLQRRRTATV